MEYFLEVSLYSKCTVHMLKLTKSTRTRNSLLVVQCPAMHTVLVDSVQYWETGTMDEETQTNLEWNNLISKKHLKYALICMTWVPKPDFEFF